MKRYLVFGFDAYYPCGGLNDLVGNFDTIEEAKAEIDLNSTKRDFYQCFDCEERKMILDI